MRAFYRKPSESLQPRSIGGTVEKSDHLPRRVFMKTKLTLLLLAATALWAQGDVYHPACTNATLQGYYGFTITGTRPSAPTPGAPVETIVGVAMTYFDGAGNLTQTDNIHGSITGFPAPDRPGKG